MHFLKKFCVLLFAGLCQHFVVFTYNRFCIGCICLVGKYNVEQLFISCSYLPKMWAHASLVCILPFILYRDSLEEALSLWINNRAFKDFLAMSILFIWWGLDSEEFGYFDDIQMHLVVMVDKGFAIKRLFPQLDSPARSRVIGVEVIDKNHLWKFFYGASQGTQGFSGEDGILYISPTHNRKYKAGLGAGTNNYAELKALIILIKSNVILREVKQIQKYAD